MFIFFSDSRREGTSRNDGFRTDLQGTRAFPEGSAPARFSHTVQAPSAYSTTGVSLRADYELPAGNDVARGRPLKFERQQSFSILRVISMCGRFTLKTPAPRLAEVFHVPEFPQLAPRYNIAPTQLVICIRTLLKDLRTREIVALRWGLIPFWAKDVSICSRMINARSETAADKPAFRRAFQVRRCIIPADGFYEWQKLSDGTRQPWWIHRSDGEPFAFAGLWETWKSKDSEQIESCTILTTTANVDLQELHDRMPAILLSGHQTAWLSESASRGQLNEMLEPLPEGVLIRHPVARLVNKTGYEDPACVEPVSIGDSSSESSESSESADRQQSLFE